MQLISSQNFSNVTQFSISNLPQGFKDLWVYLSYQSSVAAELQLINQTDATGVQPGIFSNPPSYVNIGQKLIQLGNDTQFQGATIVISDYSSSNKYKGVAATFKGNGSVTPRSVSFTAIEQSTPVTSVGFDNLNNTNINITMEVWGI